MLAESLPLISCTERISSSPQFVPKEGQSSEAVLLAVFMVSKMLELRLVSVSLIVFRPICTEFSAYLENFI